MRFIAGSHPIRQAWIDDGETWLDILDDRRTSRTYDEPTAEEVDSRLVAVVTT
jgi:hypothetical protein